jgi:hypothetical protein
MTADVLVYDNGGEYSDHCVSFVDGTGLSDDAARAIAELSRDTLVGRATDDYWLGELRDPSSMLHWSDSSRALVRDGDYVVRPGRFNDTGRRVPLFVWLGVVERGRRSRHGAPDWLVEAVVHLAGRAHELCQP